LEYSPGEPVSRYVGSVTAFLAFLATAAGVVVVAAGLVRLGRRVRRRGVGGEDMGPFEEIWHPAAHRARLRSRCRKERIVPLPSPDDQ
jgi:hypothetical protein